MKTVMVGVVAAGVFLAGAGTVMAGSWRKLPRLTPTLGVAAYLVAATDRAVERRPQVTALALLGARARTLRAVQVVQVVLPLAVGLVLAVVVGKMAESSYLVTGGGAVFWDEDGVPLLLACALGVLVVAAVGALPLVGRRIDPELIRRD
jgi:predicted lysophospholipase L1 biosynthesis ABC-type transport system permease subunit